MVFDALGLTPTEGMRARAQRLDQIASQSGMTLVLPDRSTMIFTETKIPGVFVIELERRRDERGFFARQWCADEFARAGLDPRVAQINTARSVAAGTLRGVHYQKAPHAEVKLVRCTRGAVFDVAVDLRVDSPTFCQWFGIELDDEFWSHALYSGGLRTRLPDAGSEYRPRVPGVGAVCAQERHRRTS